MADIFVSYKKEDAGRVVRIVEGLRKEGFTVWWDHGITPGSQWDQTIQRELDAAELVVAVWSELSVHAPWVKEEASVGKAKGRLLPVRIDDVDPPLGFGLIQMSDLSDWDGDLDDAKWDFFIEAARATIEGRPVKGLEKPVKRKNPMRIVLPIMAVLVLLAGVGLYGVYWLSNLTSVSVDYEDGTSKTISATRTAQPTEAEEALFTKAQESTLRTDYLDYLRIYPQGAYANKIRETILPFCESEERKTWKMMSTDVNGSSGQALRGVSTGRVGIAVGSDSIIHATEQEACEAAKADVENTAKISCQVFERDNNSRNSVHTLIWPDKCDCEYLEAGETWICSVDPQFVCDWETLTPEFVEVCK